MNPALGLKVLGRIMNWTDDDASREFPWLKLIARLKYDGYRDFQAGMRYIESLATWLQQFAQHDRKTAYAFVRHNLVYIGPGEMQRLVERFYPRTVRKRLDSMVATACDIQPYRVFVDTQARRAEKRLRRQTLFLGLSDGARIDTIRRANAGLLSNEQFVQNTQLDSEKWEDLLDSLRKDLMDSGARFRLVYLIDDFTATGTSLLRLDDKAAKWKGKLIRFRDSLESANTALHGDKPFDDAWQLCVHHYVASWAAAEALTARLKKAKQDGAFSEGWAQDMYTSFGMTLRRDLPLDAVPGRHEDLLNLTRVYYDPIIRTKHTDIGGVHHLGLGYGGCALPLVLEHNTPNNAVALLWAESDGGDRDGVRAPAMRPLFRRRQRHV